MIKIFFSIFLFVSFLNAKYDIEKSRNLFSVKIENSDFEKDLANLKDELIFRGFKIIYELNLGKTTNEYSKLLKREISLDKGINIGVCKSSFTFQMVEENFHNINYCPLALSIYQKKDDKTTYISYKYYRHFNYGDKIADKINATLEEIIINSIE